MKTTSPAARSFFIILYSYYKHRLWFHYVTMQTILKYHQPSHKAEWSSMNVSKVQKDVIRAFGKVGVEILSPLQVSQFDLSDEDEEEDAEEDETDQGSPKTLHTPQVSSIDLTSPVVHAASISSQSTLTPRVLPSVLLVSETITVPQNMPTISVPSNAPSSTSHTPSPSSTSPSSTSNAPPPSSTVLSSTSRASSRIPTLNSTPDPPTQRLDDVNWLLDAPLSPKKGGKKKGRAKEKTSTKEEERKNFLHLKMIFNNQMFSFHFFNKHKFHTVGIL
jgi:hypothetical protein